MTGIISWEIVQFLKFCCAKVKYIYQKKKKKKKRNNFIKLILVQKYYLFKYGVKYFSSG